MYLAVYATQRICQEYCIRYSKQNIFNRAILFLVALFSFFLVSSAHAAVLIQRPLNIGLTNGLVGSWSFDGNDMASTVAYDRSGNGNNGTLTNGQKKVIGMIGSAVRSGGIIS